jgi:hypothetical protein
MRTCSWSVLSILLVPLLSGCDFVGDVIEFGLWTILILLVVAAVVVYLLIKTFFD